MTRLDADAVRAVSPRAVCQETGVDPGHLSRVLSSRSELSLRNLQRILDALDASLVILSEEEMAEIFDPGRAAEDLAGAGK